MQRSGAVEPVAPVHVEAAPQQHIEAVEMAGLGRQVQERAVPGAARDGDFSRMLGEQVVEIFGAPLDGGGNDLAVKTERIDMRLEGAPAGKAVVACDLTLGLVEFCRRIARAQLGQPLLGGLLQPFNVGTRRKRLGHGTPSFSCPVSAFSGRRRCGACQAWRWVKPFTRTVGRLLDCRHVSDGRVIASTRAGLSFRPADYGCAVMACTMAPTASSRGNAPSCTSVRQVKKLSARSSTARWRGSSPSPNTACCAAMYGPKRKCTISLVRA